MSGEVRFEVATAAAPGAIGIIQLYGDAGGLIERLTGRRVPPGHVTLARFEDIDEGVIAVLRPDFAQLMPHGGLRVIQKLSQRLIELGARPAENPSPVLTFPEAADEAEARMLATLARAASPAAIDLLLSGEVCSTGPRRRLIDPPAVVLVGRPNVGKSTLTNLVMGRAASITADLPGTTRDWVAGLAELPTPAGELAVRWFDTPGLRDSADMIERSAIALANTVIAQADVLIAMRDPQTPWPQLPPGRAPDLHVLNKCDLPGADADPARLTGAIMLCALTGQGLEELSKAIVKALHLDDNLKP